MLGLIQLGGGRNNLYDVHAAQADLCDYIILHGYLNNQWFFLAG